MNQQAEEDFVERSIELHSSELANKQSQNSLGTSTIHSQYKGASSSSGFATHGHSGSTSWVMITDVVAPETNHYGPGTLEYDLAERFVRDTIGEGDIHLDVLNQLREIPDHRMDLSLDSSTRDSEGLDNSQHPINIPSIHSSSISPEKNFFHSASLSAMRSKRPPPPNAFLQQGGWPPPNTSRWSTLTTQTTHLQKVFPPSSIHSESIPIGAFFFLFGFLFFPLWWVGSFIPSVTQTQQDVIWKKYNTYMSYASFFMVFLISTCVIWYLVIR